MIQINLIDKIKTHLLCSITFRENRDVYDIMWKNTAEPDKPQMTIHYSACALRARYPRLQTHTQNVQYLLLFHCSISCTNAPQLYVLRTLPVLLLDSRSSKLHSIFNVFMHVTSVSVSE